MKRYPKEPVLLIWLLVLLSGCAVAPGTKRAYLHIPEDIVQERIFHLKGELERLNSNVDSDEAQRLAASAIRHSLALANRYRVLRMPIFHNVLVNAGIKDRGLCVHWTEDLLRHLAALELKTFQLHWGVANRERILHMVHSSVVVTAADQSFMEGLVLDPWRHSGELYWGRVKTDSYPWEKWTHFNPKRIHESYRHP